MALIVEYHVVADMYDVTAATNISAGMLVSLVAATGAVEPAPVGVADGVPLGIAGDSSLTAEGQTTAYSAQLRTGAGGGSQRWTSNRVSDFYDESLASNKITVYNGGGKFWVSDDLFDGDAAAVVVNSLLMDSGAVAGEWVIGAAAVTGNVVAMAVGAAQAYPSGVPGTDTADGSITLGDYVPLVLRI
jgi:hypothetical protein